MSNLRATIYRACRRGTIAKAALGIEPFHLPGRIAGIEEFGSGYGRWAVRTAGLDAGTVIASFGLGEDVTFELAVAERFGCRIAGFDPTPRALDHVRSAAGRAIEAHAIALSDRDGTVRMARPPRDAADQVSASAAADYARNAACEAFDAPCVRLRSARAMHGLARLDVLKLDIEGSEYAVVEQALEDGSLAGVTQLLIEFHHFLPGLSAGQTRAAVRALGSAGFRIGWIGRTNHEYLFLRDPETERS
jgi:FkbM family methyltransferase